MVDAFRLHVRIYIYDELDVVFRSGFAGSDRAAWAARGRLDAAGVDL
jgi:hypothetical protein